MNAFLSVARKRSFKLAALVTLMVLPALLSACSSSDPTVTSTTTGQPIAWPYIFHGNFTVNGQPGPVGTRMFTMLNGEQSGSVAETSSEGVYSNLLAGANKVEDFGKTIKFYIGDPDGDKVEADQTMVFNRPAEVQLLAFDLSFPELP